MENVYLVGNLGIFSVNPNKINLTLDNESSTIYFVLENGEEIAFHKFLSPIKVGFELIEDVKITYFSKFFQLIVLKAKTDEFVCLDEIESEIFGEISDKGLIKEKDKSNSKSGFGRIFG